MTDAKPSFFKGTLAPVIVPFDEAGNIPFHSIADQTRRLLLVDGVSGIALGTGPPNQLPVTAAELREVIRQICMELRQGQFLLNMTKDHDAPEQYPPRSDQAYGSRPLAIAADPAADGPESGSDDTAAAVGAIIGKVGKSLDLYIGSENGERLVRLYFAEFLPANRSTGSYLSRTAYPDSSNGGLLPTLASVAPHEIIRFFRSNDGGLAGAQDLYDRFAPLITLFGDHDPLTRELIYREAAHYRGLLVSPDFRGMDRPLDPRLRRQVQRTIDTLRLDPIRWI